MKLKKVTGTYSLPYTIKAEWTTYLVGTILFLPIIVVILFCIAKRPETWPLLVPPTGLLIWWMIWANAFEITIKEDKIIYKTLTSRNNQIQLSDIKKIAIEIYTRKIGEATKAFYRFNIYHKSSGPLAINMKPFGQRDLAILADAIATKVPSLEMDEKTRELKEGDFKPIISQGIRGIFQLGLYLLLIYSIVVIIRALLK
ncbi:hypothetical protein ACFL1E_04595 [Candidatus Omnitrophota bacterium]